MGNIQKDKLALLGGKRAVPDGIIKSWPEIRQEDKDAVMKVLDRGEMWGANAPDYIWPLHPPV